MGQLKEKNSILIPLDILEQLAKRYRMNTDDLIKPYITGLLIERKEKKPE